MQPSAGQVNGVEVFMNLSSLMKAVWLSRTIADIHGASLVTRHWENSLPTLLIIKAYRPVVSESRWHRLLAQ